MTTCNKSIGIGLLTVAALTLWPAGAAAAVTVSVGKANGEAGKEVKVPISVKNVKEAKGISCIQIRLNYDPALLTLKAIEKGPVLPNAVIGKSVDETADPGKAGLGIVCGSKGDGKGMASIDQDGVILFVVFEVNAKATSGQKCPLKLDNARVLDTQEPPYELAVALEDGEFGMGGLVIPWLWIGIAAGILILLLVIRMMARGKGQAAPQTPYSVPQGGAPRMQPQSPTISHTCSKCGGVLQLPIAMRGQTFQCGACGMAQVAGS